MSLYTTCNTKDFDHASRQILTNSYLHHANARLLLPAHIDNTPSESRRIKFERDVLDVSCVVHTSQVRG